MKSLQINIKANNVDDKFKLNVEINNLSREDATKFEHRLSDHIEGVISKYIEGVAEALKEYDPEAKYNKTKI